MRRERPWILNLLDGLAILIVFMVNIVRFLAYLGAKTIGSGSSETFATPSGHACLVRLKKFEFGFETWFKGYGRKMRKEARTGASSE